MHLKTKLGIKPLFSLGILAFAGSQAIAQDKRTDSIVPYTFHFQQTLVTQWHPDFQAKYSGPNSFQTHEKGATSITSTIYAGIRPLKNLELYVNPELAGGQGLSHATGIAGFPNGETFRVGNPTPTIYLARAFGIYTLPLTSKRTAADLDDRNEFDADDLNHVAGATPTHYLRFIAGKYCLADFFDQNSYSHDPRTQFLNWSLMANAAWDYPADVRGYTMALTVQYRKDKWQVQAATSLEPKLANGPKLNYDYGKSNGEVIEVAHTHTLNKHEGNVRLMAFINQAPMGNYRLALKGATDTPDITAARKDGRTKYGFGINIDQEITKSGGAFLKASWNDGHNETWAYTEIDQSLSAGWLQNGQWWHRAQDNAGIAIAVNGLSKDHRDYLAAGGTGFMVGDGRLNYAPEMIAEVFYQCNITRLHIALSPDYQFVLHPAYNKDRGPVNIIGIRTRVAF
ncbi:high affinity Mn2+ porin [Chitinophaga polysaccharea]|uniref:High affinity Mn2+ porin n=1 Tax=Chitinophaga polysaccharea TaxID=1293035 RepID=A0A561PWJ0_9BACT|nr:carbohydrate porin [Chitinophaga polysaccharea]TWF42472.1 high affinity Mn2+ porin [Chitinophaga polysaccharea]